MKTKKEIIQWFNRKRNSWDNDFRDFKAGCSLEYNIMNKTLGTGIKIKKIEVKKKNWACSLILWFGIDNGECFRITGI